MSCIGQCDKCNQCANLMSIALPFNLEQYDSRYGKPTNAVLNLTDECTHRCKMCFVNFNPRRMEYSTAKAAVEFVIKNNEGKDTTPSIIFFGGEPLLEFESIIVPLIKEYGGQINWSITTNGLLLDEDKIDFFRNNKVNILFSFDGDRFTQNLQRPLKNGEGSFDVNVKNIPYYVLRYPYSEMRATVTKESIPHLYENFLFAKNMGFHCVDFIMDSRSEIIYTEDDEKELEKQLNKIAVSIITDLILGHERIIQFNGLINAFTRIESQDTQPIFNTSIHRCGTGVTSVGVGVDGRIFPCQEQSSCADDDIGDVFNGISPEKHFLHLKKFEDTVTKLGEKMNSNAINLFTANQFCPNRLLHDGELGEGHLLMSKVLYKVAYRLRLNHSNSPNKRVYKYFYHGGRKG